MKNNLTIFLILFINQLFLGSCTSEDPKPINTIVKININHKAGIKPIQFNQLKYHNQAGNNYSISKLEYYLSNFIFLEENGTAHNAPGLFYINALDSTTCQINIELPIDLNFKSIQFNFGLTPSVNRSNSLPNNSENISMAWPDPMGGGYHFMKFEGKYIDDQQKKGFAIHLGTNLCEFQDQLDINLSTQSEMSPIEFNMDINEWFANPNTYDFKIDGYYTMGDSTLMKKVIQNAGSVFSIKKL